MMGSSSRGIRGGNWNNNSSNLSSSTRNNNNPSNENNNIGFRVASPWLKVSQDRLKTFDLAWSFQVLRQLYFFRDYPRFLRIGLLSGGRIIAWWLGW